VSGDKVEIVTDSLKGIGKSFASWRYSGITAIVAISLILHFILLAVPSDFVGDEVFYVGEARHAIDGTELGHSEHPPMGKLFTVFGMLTFGDNPVGWRLFPVIFATLGILFFYLICRELKLPNWASNLATALFAFENLSFVLGSIAMLDVYYVSLMLGGFYFYLRRRYQMSGLLIALSMLAKLTGILAFGAIFIHWFFFRRKETLPLVGSVFIAYAAFFLFLPAMEYLLTSEWSNPFVRIGSMIDIGLGLNLNDYSNPWATRPWEWLTGYQVMVFWYVPQYLGAISPTIWAISIPQAIFGGWQALKRNAAAVFSLGWFVATYLIWIPISMITDRITYVYYFYPAVGAICLGVGIGAIKLFEWRPKLAVSLIALFLLLHVGFFLALSPFTQWWPI
jgi:predicted membrane-bound dolichyl-phosphate-mannose-protein mannosyltransferase